VLRTVAGKLSNAARLMTAWRPFLNEFWAALSSSAGTAPRGTVWTKQVLPAIHWFLAFLRLEGAAIIRPFLFKAFELPASRTTFILDASPWGYGGVLMHEGRCAEYFYDAVSTDDCEMLNIQVGVAESQQVVESLTMLIALRVWAAEWRQFRSSVAVRGDNITMLTMLAHFKGSTPALNLLAREVALDVAAAAYRPVRAEHIPGVANTVADVLSRFHMPGSAKALPECLVGCTRADVPARTRSWYRSLVLPGDPPMASGVDEGSAARS
jgi:hypothetical protein